MRLFQLSVVVFVLNLSEVKSQLPHREMAAQAGDSDQDGSR